MHYDVVIIGAGLSGLAAGIRLALFEKRVCILERHYAYGGLNSYYKRHGREFDVGLHALTNFVAPEVRSTPLPKVLRQLRIPRDELLLCPQHHSEIRFPGRQLRWSNDPVVLLDDVAREFPRESARFEKLFRNIQAAEYAAAPNGFESARRFLNEAVHDAILVEMILCPVMYYGSPREHDMELVDFVTIFKSLYCEGLARPRGGVRTLLKALVRRFRACGGRLRMRCGVHRLMVQDQRVAALQLDNGEEWTADVVLSCAGAPETFALCDSRPPSFQPVNPGRISFVESFLVLNRAPMDLGLDATIVFFNDADSFTYAAPNLAVDVRSGVAACPNNYEGDSSIPEGLFRLTWLANYDQWAGLSTAEYVEQKKRCFPQLLERARSFMPDVEAHVVDWDLFTPRTIRQFTGHGNGAVYGSPDKLRDGRTPYKNLFLCGTDQGQLGIIGAMMSGVMMANTHVLAPA